MSKPVRVAVTGPAGQIGYSLLIRIASGQMFGPETPVILQLLEIPNEKALAALNGVVMEIQDCAFPLVREIIQTSDPMVGFKDADWALLVGSKPRGPGMERADLLKDNGAIFVGQGKAIDAVASADCKVVVVGNPCNTNAMIGASQCNRVPKTNWTAMVRLDENRAKAQLALKAGVGVEQVSNTFIFGNHSPTMYPAFPFARIGARKATEVITDKEWLEGAYCETVGKRGAAIIAARGLSSAASAANALTDHVRDLNTPGKIHSIAVSSEGLYGFSPNVWAGMPVVTTAPGKYQVIKDFTLTEFCKKKIAGTNEELVGEYETVKHLLG